MSGDLLHDRPASSNLGRVLAFVAIPFVLALGAVFIARAVHSPGATATALFQVSYEPSTIFEIGRDTIQDWEILKKTQLALLKSNFVLTAATRPPGVASVSALAGKEDPVEWLQENLVVDFPQDGEILSISLSGDGLPEDLVILVDAVAKAYKDEVVNDLRERRLATRDLLARNLENLNKAIKRKLEEYLDIARETGKLESSSGKVLQQLDAKRLDRIENEIMRLATLAIDIGSDAVKRESIEYRLEQLAEQKSKLTSELTARVERSADMETRKEDLKQLQVIANDMSVKLQQLDIDAAAPDRIRQVQQAVIAKDE